MRMLMLAFVLVGALLAALGLPLALGRVPPNAWYGFRVRATLQNPDLWYPVNAYTGRLLLGTGIILAIAAIVIPAGTRVSPRTYALVLTALLVIGTLTCSLLSWLYLRQLVAGPQ